MRSCGEKLRRQSVDGDEQRTKNEGKKDRTGLTNERDSSRISCLQLHFSSDINTLSPTPCTSVG